MPRENNQTPDILWESLRAVRGEKNPWVSVGGGSGPRHTKHRVFAWKILRLRCAGSILRISVLEATGITLLLFSSVEDLAREMQFSFGATSKKKKTEIFKRMSF